MGLFTYRQVKKGTKQLKGLRGDQALDAQIQRNHQAVLANRAREDTFFQQLPPEGKAEFRTVVEAYEAQAKTWSNFKEGFNGKEVRQAKQALGQGKQAIFRKYDLVP